MMEKQRSVKLEESGAKSSNGKAGDKVEGDGELGPPDWRVRAATHVPFRLIDGQRTAPITTPNSRVTITQEDFSYSRVFRQSASGGA